MTVLRAHSWLLMDSLWDLNDDNVVLGIEPGLVVCEVNTLLSIHLSLAPNLLLSLDLAPMGHFTFV